MVRIFYTIFHIVFRIEQDITYIRTHILYSQLVMHLVHTIHVVNGIVYIMNRRVKQVKKYYHPFVQETHPRHIVFHPHK